MSKYSYNKAVGKQASERKLHAEGIYARMITGIERYVHEDKDELTVIVRSQALSNPEDPETIVPGTDLADFFTLPLNNPEVPDHDFLAGEWADLNAKQWAEFAAAVWPEDVKEKPLRREVNAKGKPSGPYWFDGEEIDSEDYAKYLQQTIDAAGEKATKLLEALDAEEDMGPKGFGPVGSGYYAAIRIKEKDSIKRVNQVAYRRELPDTWAENLVTDKDAMVAQPANDPDKAGNGKPRKGGSSKPPKRAKKTKKKAGGRGARA